MDHATHCNLLARELDNVDAAFRAADPTASVPSCPDWRTADLATHLGTAHRWVQAIVSERRQKRLPFSELKVAVPAHNAGADDWADWLVEGGETLVATLLAADPDAPVWVWGDDPHMRWWSRRQLHETVVHRIDAELAAGREWTVDPEVAADATDEYLGNIVSSGRFSAGVANLVGDGSIHLHTTDTEGEWMIDLTPDGFSIDHRHGKGTVAARGIAADLLAAMYGRGPLDRLEIFGDRQLLEWWITNSALHRAGSGLGQAPR